MTFWDFADKYFMVWFLIFYCLITYVEGIIEARKKDKPKWEKIK